MQTRGCVKRLHERRLFKQGVHVTGREMDTRTRDPTERMRPPKEAHQRRESQAYLDAEIGEACELPQHGRATHRSRWSERRVYRIDDHRPDSSDTSNTW